MATFFAVFNRRAQTGKQPISKTVAVPGATAETGVAKTTEVVSTGNLEDAVVLKLEGITTVAQAQAAVQSLYPGLVNGKTVVVTEAAFKES